MRIRSTIPAILAVALIFAAALTAPPLRADPAHPTVSEVTSVAYMLNFRSGMLADPAKTVSTYAAGAARGQFAAINQQMVKSGSGPLG